MDIVIAIVGLVIIAIVIFFLISMLDFLINVGLLILGLLGVFYGFEAGFGWSIAGAIATLIGGFNAWNIIKDGELFESTINFGESASTSATVAEHEIDPTDESHRGPDDQSAFAQALKNEDSSFLSSSDPFYGVAKGLIEGDPAYAMNVEHQCLVQAILEKEPSLVSGDLRGFAEAIIEGDPNFAPSDMYYLAKAIIEREPSYL